MHRPTHHRPTFRTAAALVAVSAIVLGACSDSDDDAAESTESNEESSAESTPEPTEPTDPPATDPPETTAVPETTDTPTTTAAPTTVPPTTTPPTTAPPTTIAALTDVVDLAQFDPGPEDDIPVLGPGAYTIASVDPLAFEFTEEIQMLIGTPESVALRDPVWPLDQRAASILLLELNGLVLPEQAADDAVRNLTGPAAPEQTLPTPVDFPAWVDAVDNVSISDSGVIQAPATDVSWFDVLVDPAAGPTFRCAADTTDCVGALVTSPDATGVVPLQAQNLQRVYLFDALPGVVGLVDAREAEFFARGVEIMDMIAGSLAPTG